ncbi:MAG: hypothetical protein KBD27_01265 [Candidatus Moranbacteria bacterium]|nr:hypothetical protein [Candidatus Moranbacteria bacterium]
MGDVVRRDSFKKRLSQLKKTSLAITSFFPQKGFSIFSLLFVGAGIFPALPPIDTNSITQSEEVFIETDRVVSEEEMCRWQNDFSFFSRLEKGEVSLQKGIPCEEKKEVVFRTVDAVPVPVTDNDLTQTIRDMTTGYPMEVMAPAISAYDRQVAGLIVGIAKKESNWGKRVPVDTAGADCFNYWGFKGAGSRGVAMGHGCFGSPEEAVQAVGNRIAELVAKRQTSEPKNMTIWKCGSSCATHSPESVRKWIADVDLYYRQIVKN